MSEHFECPICASTSFSPLPLRTDAACNKEFTYRICNTCRLVCADPIPTKKESHIIYSQVFDYSWYQKVAFFKKVQAQKRIKIVTPVLCLKSKILDIGSGHGYFVNALRNNGYLAYGFEPDGGAIISLQNHIFRASSLLSIPETFDIITLCHSLEHFNDLSTSLQQIKKLLKPNGILIIAVPNFDSIGQSKRAGEWVWLQQSYIHIWHFNDENLSALLNKEGFTPNKLFTRDTWDAQLYDYTKFFYITLLLYRLFFRKVDIAIIESYVRLLTLPLSILLNITLFKFLNNGSELVVIAQSK